MSGPEHKQQEWGVVALHQEPGGEGATVSASSAQAAQQQRSPRTATGGAGAAANGRAKAASIEMTSPSWRQQQAEPSPGFVRRAPPEESQGPEEPLSEAEEEQIKMEAQVSMLLTAARSTPQTHNKHARTRTVTRLTQCAALRSR